MDKMETTKKLYDLDAYQTEFDGEVLSCEPLEKKEGTVYQVILDQIRLFSSRKREDRARIREQ